MILVRNIRLPLSAGEPQAFEKALHTLRVPRSKVEQDRKSTRLNSSHKTESRMPSSA